MKRVALFAILAGLFIYWFRGGITSVYFDTDMGRDLSELSILLNRHIVWLGPHLSAGFPASPLYYYLLFPFLLLGRGNPDILILANAIFGTAVLAAWGILGLKKYGKYIIPVIGITGLLPWFSGNILHFGNGYTYFIFVLLSLISLWFELPLFLSSLFLGIAISFHPAAVFALPFLLYELIRNKNKWKSSLFVLIGLILPWTPIILFEIITRGYLTRQWLAHPGYGLVTLKFSSVGILILICSILAALFLFRFNKRMITWAALSFPAAGFLFLAYPLPLGYSLGIYTILSFILLNLILELPYSGKFLTPAFLSAIFISVFIIPFPKPAARTIDGVGKTVNGFLSGYRLEKNNRIAVVAALTRGAEVPQADDYRYFLRLKGYNVLEVQNYSSADTLIEFIEAPGFNWQGWSTWETEQVSPKILISSEKIGGVVVNVFKRN